MFAGSASVHVDAAPEEVWRLVTDVARMGEWSPECYRAEWLDGATGPAVGARFRGWNRDLKHRWMKWSTSPTVTVVEPGRAFGFSTGDTDWTYELEPASGGGTTLTERYEVKRYNLLFKLVAPVSRRKPVMDAALGTTLERIKSAAESSRTAPG